MQQTKIIGFKVITANPTRGSQAHHWLDDVRLEDGRLLGSEDSLCGKVAFRSGGLQPIDAQDVCESCQKRVFQHRLELLLNELYLWQ